MKRAHLHLRVSGVIGGNTFSYLLDSYPATVAYSVRQLKTGVTNVVRVRRSSDNTEQDFTAAQVTDGTLTTFTGAGNGFVATWYDQSGNGYNATRATQANQPQIVSSGVVITDNGKPAILFDGVDDYLYSASGVTQALLDRSWAVVYSSSGSADGVFGTPFDGASLWGIFTTNLELNASGPKVTWTADGAPTLITANYVHSTTIGTAYKNSVLAGSQNRGANTAINSSAIRIGNDRLIGVTFFIGKMQELIYWETSQTANRTAIESNINTHYGIY